MKDYDGLGNGIIANETLKMLIRDISKQWGNIFSSEDKEEIAEFIVGKHNKELFITLLDSPYFQWLIGMISEENTGRPIS